VDLDVRDDSPSLLIGETVALDPAGTRIARPGRRRQLRRTYSIDVWDAESLTLITTLRGHSGQILALAWSPDGRWLASSAKDQTLLIWDTQSGQNRVLDRDGSADVEALAFSPDGTRLASGSADGRVVIHDLGNGRNIGQAGAAIRSRSMFGRHEGAVRALAWHPAGEVLASASADDTIQLFGTQRGEPLHRLQGHNGDVLCLVFSSDGSRLFSGSRDKTVRVWHTDLGLSLLTMSGMRFPVEALAVELDGRRLITVEASTIPTVRVWDSSLVDVQEMWREREDARQARSLVAELLGEYHSGREVLAALAGRTDIDPGVRGIALVLAGRLQE
jgi:WD40 repeat protein